MIKIKIVKDNNYIKQITLKGHANYSEYGKDIVCAAVSATYLCTINGILSISPEIIELSSSNDTQIIDVIRKDDIVEKLLKNMIKCLESLEQEYPNNINIK